jgi:hypothetical protein
MRFTVSGALVALLAVDGVLASSWFGKTGVYPHFVTFDALQASNWASLAN